MCGSSWLRLKMQQMLSSSSSSSRTTTMTLVRCQRIWTSDWTSFLPTSRQRLAVCLLGPWHPQENQHQLLLLLLLLGLGLPA
jgi:hypothetical protein